MGTCNLTPVPQMKKNRLEFFRQGSDNGDVQLALEVLLMPFVSFADVIGRITPRVSVSCTRLFGSALSL